MHSLDTPSQALVTLDRIRYALAEAEDLGQIKSIRDMAEAVRQYARSASLGLELQNQAAEVKLLAERRAGALLAALHLKGGDRKSGRKGRSVSLGDLGLSHNQSARWQLEASVPEEVFAGYLREAAETGRELTSHGLVRLARNGREAVKGQPPEGELALGEVAAALRVLAEHGKTFATVHADPPPPGGKRSRERWMEGLAALPVRRLTREQAHLHLWVVPELLEDGLKVLRAWGFRYQTALVWTKPPSGYGPYWRQAHELLLLGVRGQLPFRDTSLGGWLDGRQMDRKRDVRELIERVSSPPYLDVFGRRAATGWMLAAPATGPTVLAVGRAAFHSDQSEEVPEPSQRRGARGRD